MKEPDSSDKRVDLDEVYECHAERSSVAAVIRRCYHAERERDQLRARVAELEATKGVAGE